MTDRNERQRKRYAEDPEFRARLLASHNAFNERNREKINAKQRLRWATDPEYREHMLALQKASRMRNKDEINAKQRLKWATLDPTARQRALDQNHFARLKRRYGITIEEYHALLARQKGRCAFCKKKPKPKRRLHVDHCHRRKLVRFLLCGKCNRGIGFFDDDPRVLRAAAAGLSRFVKRKPRPPGKPPRKKRR